MRILERGFRLVIKFKVRKADESKTRAIYCFWIGFPDRLVTIGGSAEIVKGAISLVMGRLEEVQIHICFVCF